MVYFLFFSCVYFLSHEIKKSLFSEVLLVGAEGLEPSRHKSLDFKSNAYTDSATLPLQTWDIQPSCFKVGLKHFGFHPSFRLPTK